MTIQARFPATSRLLHWLMAPMIVAMLFIGVGMAASVSARYELLVSIHRPLGVAILVLCVIRIINRFINPPPDLPDTVPSLQRFAARASHIVLYALMFIMPVVGWGMLSAARYPIVLYGPLRLPPIFPHNLTLYAWLRDLHTDLAYLFFATFLVHFGAALYHGLVLRDGAFGSMASFQPGSIGVASAAPASIQDTPPAALRADRAVDPGLLS
jgi:cytochrome b561